MNAPDVTYRVAEQFAKLRRRYLRVRLCSIAVTATAALLAVWIAIAVGDYFGEWSRGWRIGVLTTVAIAIVGWSVVMASQVITTSRRRRFAALLEHVYVDFGQRVRTVLDTVEGRVQGPAEMLSALGHQTLGRWELASPDKLIPLRKLGIAAAACLAAVAIGLALFTVGGDWRTALKRAAGARTPYTTFEVVPGDTKVVEGASINVSLNLAGRTDRDVTLRYRPLAGPDADGDSADVSDKRQAKAAAQDGTPVVDETWIETNLPATADETKPTRQQSFTAMLGQAERPLEYQFVYGGQVTPTHRIDIQPLIKADRIEIEVRSPAYTGLEPRTFPLADVTVLERSDVTVTVQLNHPLDRATLHTGRRSSQLEPVELTAGADPTSWTFALPSDHPLQWRMTGAGLDGTPMNPVQGRLRVRPDSAPTIRWQDPPDQVRVHTLTELPLRVQVADDYGIVESGIVFQLGGEDFVLTDWNQTTANEQQDAEQRTRLSLDPILPLESFGLSERDYIGYYAYAVDNREWGPQRVESELRYIDIRPLRQFYSEQDQDPNGGGAGRVLIQLDEIIRRERFLINRTRKLITTLDTDLASRLGTIDRLVVNQSELAGLTRFLVEFFVARGNDDVEALNRAEAAMLQAADSLSAASFELAMAQEEEALRALAEARQGLEIVLARRMTRQQQQALQRFAQQLRQKLRREKPELEQDIADSLTRIAAEQRALGDRAGKAVEQPDGPPPEDLVANEIDLLERVETAKDGLTDRLDDSPLMSARTDNVMQAMDALASEARAAELAKFARGADDAADQLQELGLQLEALTSAEPVARVSSLRDLTNSLANLERELSQSFGAEQAPTMDGDAAQSLQRLARQLGRRAETVDDVFKAPSEVGDIEMSEVNDRLAEFLEISGFLGQLQATTQVASGIESEATIDDLAAATALERAVAYAEAAQRLDQLYRQLVMPRLARLRELEQSASELAGQLNNESSEQNDVEASAGINELQQALQQEGLTELAELLSEGRGGSDDLNDQDLLDTSSASLTGGLGTNVKNRLLTGRLQLVVKELRERIQQVMLLEISVDRDLPVPVQYRRAVDGYFRTIAGDDAVLESASEMQPGATP